MAAWSTFLYAVLLLVIVLAMPGGIAALLDFRNRRPLAQQRAIVPPDRRHWSRYRAKRTGGQSLRGMRSELRQCAGDRWPRPRRPAPGEIHGLIGPNGSGKTTTLNVISGYCRPDRQA